MKTIVLEYLLLTVIVMTIFECESENDNQEQEIETEKKVVPTCSNGETITSIEDEDIEQKEEAYMIPNTCESIVFKQGINKKCAISAKGKLTIEGEEYNLSYACVQEIGISDYQGNIFKGFTINLIGENGCSPMIYFTILDMEKYESYPTTIDMNERLCPDSRMHLSGLILSAYDQCFQIEPNSVGTALIKELKVRSKYVIQAEATLISETGTRVKVELDFEAKGIGSERVLIDLLFDNVCENETEETE